MQETLPTTIVVTSIVVLPILTANYKPTIVVVAKQPLKLQIVVGESYYYMPVLFFSVQPKFFFPQYPKLTY